jgi:plasmid maintenance system antidote protein VapI
MPRALGVTRAALSALVNERAHLSPEMALHIEQAFGVSMETLMRMQNSELRMGERSATHRSQAGSGGRNQCHMRRIMFLGARPACR